MALDPWDQITGNSPKSNDVDPFAPAKNFFNNAYIPQYTTDRDFAVARPLPAAPPVSAPPTLSPPAGALTKASQSNPTPPDNDDGPSASDVQGALVQSRMSGPIKAQFDASMGALGKASDLKQQRIQDAINVLQAARGSQTTNLPLLMAGAAMMGPTKTGSIGESISNAANAAGPYIQKDRETDLGLAKATGAFGIEQADADYQYQKDAQKMATDYWGDTEKANAPLVQQDTWGNRSDATKDRQLAVEAAKAGHAKEAAALQMQLKRELAAATDDRARSIAQQRYDLGIQRLSEKTANDLANLEVKRTGLNNLNNRGIFRNALTAALQDPNYGKDAPGTIRKYMTNPGLSGNPIPTNSIVPGTPPNKTPPPVATPNLFDS